MWKHNHWCVHASCCSRLLVHQRKHAVQKRAHPPSGCPDILMKVLLQGGADLYVGREPARGCWENNTGRLVGVVQGELQLTVVRPTFKVGIGRTGEDEMTFENVVRVRLRENVRGRLLNLKTRSSTAYVAVSPSVNHTQQTWIVDGPLGRKTKIISRDEYFYGRIACTSLVKNMKQCHYPWCRAVRSKFRGATPHRYGNPMYKGRVMFTYYGYVTGASYRLYISLLSGVFYSQLVESHPNRVSFSCHLSTYRTTSFHYRHRSRRKLKSSAIRTCIRKNYCGRRPQTKAPRVVW